MTSEGQESVRVGGCCSAGGRPGGFRVLLRGSAGPALLSAGQRDRGCCRDLLEPFLQHQAPQQGPLWSSPPPPTPQPLALHLPLHSSSPPTGSQPGRSPPWDGSHFDLGVSIRGSGWAPQDLLWCCCDQGICAGFPAWSWFFVCFLLFLSSLWSFEGLLLVAVHFVSAQVLGYPRVGALPEDQAGEGKLSARRERHDAAPSKPALDVPLYLHQPAGLSQTSRGGSRRGNRWS